MKKFLISLSLLVATASAFAVPAKRGIWRTITLANGTEVKAQLVGDEHAHCWIDSNGNRYQKTTNGTYAAVSAEKMHQQRMSRRMKINRTMSKQRMSRLRKANETFVGEKKGLIILVNFTDKKFASGHDNALYKRIANEKNFKHSSGFDGSVKDYFSAQSQGVFTVDFDVVGPVQLSHPYSYYGEDDYYGEDMHAGEMIAEACKAIDSQVNFADYDWDGDGEVDQVFVLYAWHGTATYDDDDTVWPHMYTLEEGDYGSKLTLDGVNINTYACSSELAESGIDGIGTFCHEFSHCLGFPDMYDTTYSGNFGMGSWDLMCSGSYNGDAFRPAGYTSYERWVAGWIEPITLDEELSVEGMKAISEGGDAYVIYNDAYPDEYYLLENRQLTGFDDNLPAAGLLILYVDYDEKMWEYNIVNDIVDYSDEEGYEDWVNDHQRMTIFHADNDDDTKYWNSRYGYYTKTTEEGDTYPYGSNNSLTNKSKPKATLYHENANGNKLMDKSVTNITQNADGTISFNFTPTSVVIGGGATEGTLFSETFDECDGKGGNDGLWSGSIANGTFTPDNEGWESAKPFGADQCAKFGTSSIAGSATTPTFTIDGEATLTFRAGAWNAKNDKTQLDLYVDGDATLSTTSFTMVKGDWTDFTTTITGTGDVAIQFVSGGRFFLDEILAQAPTTGITTVGTTNTEKTGVVYDLHGRRIANGLPFQRLPKGIYIVDGKKVVR